MSEFNGAAHKVRCVDCTKLSGNHCSIKKIKVSPKKKRLCSVYEFKGEYENRTPPEARYMPYVSKNTRRLLKKLMNLGVLPVSSDPGQVAPYGAPAPGSFQSTATAPIASVGEVERSPQAAGK
ncbi:MAG: hypothetical protein GF334_07930, partial [Candidatus Altiarchaeales archaeon]|nr:hypothetical protein [Candidatus Altiarchaeales archaeon]